MSQKNKNIDPKDAIAKLSHSTDETLLLVFNAEWSSTSSMTQVIVDKIGKTAENIHTVIVDVEKHKDLTTKYRIKKVPTCILLGDSEMKFRHEGMFSKKMILDRIDERLAN